MQWQIEIRHRAAPMQRIRKNLTKMSSDKNAPMRILIGSCKLIDEVFIMID